MWSAGMRTAKMLPMVCAMMLIPPRSEGGIRAWLWPVRLNNMGAKSHEPPAGVAHPRELYMYPAVLCSNCRATGSGDATASMRRRSTL